MREFVLQHQGACLFGAYFIFSNAVSSMPSPDEKSGKGYIWAFGFLHGLAGNLGRVFARKFPQVEEK
jgi:Na+-translocating ferredoxin:NAD+ oxidoreductase RnfD subunit